MPIQATPLDGWDTTILDSLVGGLDTSLPPDKIARSRSPNLLNVRFQDGELLADTGYLPFGGTVVGDPQGIFQVKYKDGSTDLVLITTSRMYKWASGAWEIINTDIAAVVENFDYTDCNETDVGADRVSVVASAITITDLDDDEVVYVNFAFSANYWDSEPFSHEFDFQIDVFGGLTNMNPILWGLADGVGSYDALSGVNRGFWLGLDTDDKLRLQALTDAGGSTADTSDSAISTGTPYYVRVTWDGTTLTAYIFTASMDGTPFDTLAITPAEEPSQYLYAMNNDGAGGGGAAVDGSINNLIIHGVGSGRICVTADPTSGFADGDPIQVTLSDSSKQITTVKSRAAGPPHYIDLTDLTTDSVDDAAAIVEIANFSGDLGDPIVGVMWVPDDQFIWTNNNDNVQKFDGANCSDVSNLPSAGDTKCRGVAVFNNYVVLIGTTEGGTAYPQRVRWCDTGDPTDWSTGNAGFQDLWDTEDFNLCGELLGPYLIIYREKSIYRMSYIGSSNLLFSFAQMVGNKGIISSKGIANRSSHHLLFGNDSIYKYTGGFDLEPVGDPISSLVYGKDGEINPAYEKRAFVINAEDIGEIWFVYAAGSETEPKKVLRYSEQHDSFSIREFPVGLLGHGFYQLTDDVAWSELVGIWSGQTWNWNDRAYLVNVPSILLCGNDNQAYEYNYIEADDDGATINWFYETPDLADDSPFRVDRVSFAAKGTSVLVEYSFDGGDSWATYGSAVLDTDYTKYDTHRQLVTRKVRLRFSGSGIGFGMKWLSIKLRVESEW